MGDSSEAKDGGPARASLANRIVLGSVATLLLAGAGLLFDEILQSVNQAFMVVTTDGWLLVGFLSFLFGSLAFGAPRRIGLPWRFVAGAITAFVVASGVLFLMGTLLALMSGIG